MKSFTDIEQSKKLAEKLPLESADMGWYYSKDPHAARNQMWLGTKVEGSDIPCWSLAALLNVIPSGKALIHDKGSRRYKCICNNIDTYLYDNPIDACVEMILKLKENNLL